MKTLARISLAALCAVALNPHGVVAQDLVAAAATVEANPHEELYAAIEASTDEDAIVDSILREVAKELIVNDP